MEGRCTRKFIGFHRASMTDFQRHLLTGKGKKAEKVQHAKQHAARKVKNSAGGGRMGALHHGTVGTRSATGHGSTPPAKICTDCMPFFRSRQGDSRTFRLCTKIRDAAAAGLCLRYYEWQNHSGIMRLAKIKSLRLSRWVLHIYGVNRKRNNIDEKVASHKNISKDF